MTHLEEALSGTGQTERNTDTSPISGVGQSSDSVLHSQTESNTGGALTASAIGNTPPTKKSDPSEWLTVKEAFRRLGGVVDSAASVVTSKDGRRKVKFGTFRTLTAQDYKAFGLEPLWFASLIASFEVVGY